MGASDHHAELGSELAQARKRLAVSRLLEPRPDPSSVPLSAAQERLWYLNQMDPASASFVRPVAMRLLGDLDATVLKDALAGLVRRHTVLRTRCVSVDGRPVQEVTANCEVELVAVELSDSDARAFGPESFREVLSDPSLLVDLAHPPLLRARLFRLGREEHVLLLAFHHTVMDAWSAEIVFSEMSALYNDLASGNVSRLTEPRLEFADFAAHQRSQIETGGFDQNVARIVDKLSARDALNLPTDRRRPQMRSVRGDEVLADVPGEVIERLTAIGSRTGSTLFMILVSAFGILLSKWGRTNTITLGCPVAARSQPGTESMLGFFVNRFIIMMTPDRHSTFEDLLRQVRTETLEGLSLAETPFELVLDHLERGGLASDTPAFQSVFNLENVPEQSATNGDVLFERVRIPHHVSLQDVSVEAQRDGAGLKAAFIFNPDQFDRAAIECMARQYTVLLEGIAAGPDRPIVDLPLMTLEERSEIIDRWSRSRPVDHASATLHDTFERQAHDRPNSVALVCGTDEITYGELNARANRLARHLLDSGVTSRERVAIRLHRSTDLIVVMLAILKTGAAYVPLDPLQPEARQEKILERIRPSVLVSTSDLGSIRCPAGCPVVELDRERETIQSQDTSNLGFDVSPSATAYVLFTSGSTGEPKGVITSHDSVLRFLESIPGDRFGPGQTHLLVSSVTFDMSNSQHFGALLYGGKCVIFEEDYPTPTSLAAIIARNNVSFVRMTASLFSLVVDEVPGAFRTVRFLSTGGEVMSVPHVRRAMSENPGCVFANWYGPTEITSTATEYVLDRLPPADASSIPIGVPNYGRSVYILDEQLGPVPPGVPGELYVGGDGLADGYLDDEDQTGATFVADPFAEHPGARMYRTGDLGRFLPDGNIEFLGRVDRQVKIRGYRAEPGETEMTIRSHPDVKDAAVVTVELAHGDLAFAAFVLPSSRNSLTESALRQFLEERVPHYLVPHLVDFVDEIPLTTTNKKDYKSLSARARSLSARSQEFRPPETETQKRLASIWSDVLGVKQVGLDDDFFIAGGHSLLAAKLYVRIEREFGVDIPIATLFGAPTVKSLADLIDREESPQQWSPLIRIKPDGLKPAFFCIAQGNIVGLERLAAHLPDDRAFYGLQNPMLHRDSDPEMSIESLAADYLKEVRRIQPHGPYLLGGRCTGSIVAYEMAKRLRAEGEEVPLLAVIDTIRPPSVVGPDGKSIHRGLDEAVNRSARRSWRAGALKRRIARRFRYLRRRFLLAEHNRKMWRIRWTMFRLRREYRPEQYDGPITLFRSNKKPRANEIQALWKHATSGSFEVRTIEGNHNTIWREPLVTETAKELVQRINEVL